MVINKELDNFQLPIYSTIFHINNHSDYLTVRAWCMEQFGEKGSYSYNVSEGFDWSIYIGTGAFIRVCFRKEEDATWFVLWWS